MATEIEATRLRLIEEMQDALYRDLARALARLKGLSAERAEADADLALDLAVDALLSGADPAPNDALAETIVRWQALDDEARPLRERAPTR
jgi:hypothetical protein